MSQAYQQLAEYHCRLQAAVHEYLQGYALHNQTVARRRQIIAALCFLIKQRKKKYKPKRFWISELCETRPEYGAFYSIYPCLLLDRRTFRNYCRMTSVQFEELVTILEPEIKKQHYFRKPISPRERLLLTLRYLASGDSQTSIAYEFGLGKTTLCHIILEVCTAIWKCLRTIVLPVPSKENWKTIAREFEEQWNFPHCIGAIDGKHVVITAPAHSGSTYYNYKGTHSLVLLAICDAQYRFTVVDIGAEGRQSDGGIFRRSRLGEMFLHNQADVPPPSILEGTDRELPYVLIGDPAFPLSDFLMRPYPDRTGIAMEKRVFNYRLSRARRMMESSFGILVSQWRIFTRPINTNENTAQKIIEACICLHNWIRRSNVAQGTAEPDILTVGEEVQGSAIRNISQAGSNTYSRSAAHIRDSFAEYFSTEGSVEWQWNLF